MFVIFMAFMGPVFHALVNIIDAHITGNIFKKVTVFGFFSGITNSLALPFLLVIGMPQAVPLNLFGWMVLISVIDFVYVFPYFMALKIVDTSIVAGMFSLGKVLVPVLAYFWIDEVLGLGQYAGFAMIIGANLVLNYDGNARLKINKGFWLMLMVSVMISTQVVIFKRVLNDFDWLSVAIYCTLMTNLMFFGLIFVPKIRRELKPGWKVYKKNFKLFLGVEVCDRIGAVAPLYALSVLPVVVRESIEATQPIFVLLFGTVLFWLYGDKFKEDLGMGSVLKKVICFGLIAAGVVMVIG